MPSSQINSRVSARTHRALGQNSAVIQVRRNLSLPIILAMLPVAELRCDAQPIGPALFNPELVARGEQLAAQYCGGCHQQPHADLLDRATWHQEAMPSMFYVLGLNPESHPPGKEGERIRNSGGVLNAPLMRPDQLAAIGAYYVSNAPPRLPGTTISAPIPLSKTFRKLRFIGNSRTPNVSLTRFSRSGKNLVTGVMIGSQLRRLDLQGERFRTLGLDVKPVAMLERNDGLWVTSIGDFLPTEAKRGKVVFLKQSGNDFAFPQIVLTNLHRAVDTQIADLNADGREDLIVSQFGWYTGRLSWFERHEDGRFEEHVVLPMPGALKTEIHDFNGDGHPDIAALFAQSWETMCIFLNNGYGQFEMKTLFQKQPAFGHGYFQFYDHDGDGDLDLLTANGDNGDYHSPVKPYHGVRIYRNDGEYKFTEIAFMPMPGVMRALPVDFEGDGDFDVAAISYYPEYAKDRRAGFMLFTNDGKNRFSAATINEADAGRWITMDAADFDGDGDQDLALGSLMPGPAADFYIPKDLMDQWKELKRPVLLIENLSR